MGGFFGTLHPEWKPEPFFSILEQAARKARRKVCLISMGRLGPGEKLWDLIACKYGERFHFIRLGERSARQISHLLQAIDFGIAASPWQLIGKSGTAAAMIDHGLPVIVTRDDFLPRIQPVVPPVDDSLFHLCDDRLESKLVVGLQKRLPKPRVTAVAKMLLAQLEESFNSSMAGRLGMSKILQHRCR